MVARFLAEVPLTDWSLTKVKASIQQFAQTYFPGHAQVVADKITAEYITSNHVTTPEQCRTAAVEVTC